LDVNCNIAKVEEGHSLVDKMRQAIPVVYVETFRDNAEVLCVSDVAGKRVSFEDEEKRIYYEKSLDVEIENILLHEAKCRSVGDRVMNGVVKVIEERGVSRGTAKSKTSKPGKKRRSLDSQLKSLISLKSNVSSLRVNTETRKESWTNGFGSWMKTRSTNDVETPDFEKVGNVQSRTKVSQSLPLKIFNGIF